ncbi:hypothetical protein [Aestuariivivens sediminis]|nr:hypothetical protein [Aestuariivivens sediminis]
MAGILSYFGCIDNPVANISLDKVYYLGVFLKFRTEELGNPESD